LLLVPLVKELLPMATMKLHALLVLLLVTARPAQLFPSAQPVPPDTLLTPPLALVLYSQVPPMLPANKPKEPLLRVAWNVILPKTE
jgi:hypothetical protein